jgi:hypothetical protein
MFGVSETELDPRGTKSKLFFKSLTSRLCDQMRKSLQLSLIAVFAALHLACVRVFLLVPCGLSAPLGVSREVFIGGAVSSYLEDGIVVLISLIAEVPVC